MNYTIGEIDINESLKKLELDITDGLSFFPENIESAGSKDDLIFSESVTELNKYFRIANQNISFFGGDTESYRSRKYADIYLPAILISTSFLSENPNAVSIALNIISSYVYDCLKGSMGKNVAKIEFLVEHREKGKVTKIDYKGDAEGIKALEKVIKSLK